MRTLRIWWLVLAVFIPAHAAHPVINEIMYHPPDDQDALQYVELFNPAAADTDLSGWRLAGGIKFTFPRGAAIPAGGYLVIARDLSAFQTAHSSPALGPFTGKLSHKGEKIELVNAAGAVIEKLHFQDQAPWPLGADGYGSSLERICAGGPAEDPRNWSASSRAGASGGSPGEANSAASPRPLPSILNVQWPKLAAPGQPIEISAEVTGPAPVTSVELQFSTIRPGRASAATNLPMRPLSGRYTAQIPPQPAGTLVRFTVRAADEHEAERVEPGPAEPRPAFSAFVDNPPERARVPIMTLLNPEPVRGSGHKMSPPRRVPDGAGQSMLLHVPPEGEIELFDFVQVRRRSGGWKVHFLRDQRLDGMSAINLIFEGSPRWLLAEHLSYELFRKAGMKIQKSGHARLTVDGRPPGYYLMVEQPNKTFLARTGRESSGDLYKVIWYGQSIIDKHEKKTNPQTGHANITSLIENLRKKSGAAQWAYIHEHFDVDAWVNYYAVNMCIQDWDGFFNNHYLYHNLKPGGKWEVIPWDKDKTWGDFDGAPQDYSWYDMPLTTGMNGDRPARGGWFSGGPFGGSGWWRPPGMISGPLLAHPQFRQKMEARLRELCNTVFTAEQFGPVIQELQKQLRPEVEFKARAARQDPGPALRQFDAEIASFQRQLLHRRKFILSQLK